MDCFVAGLLGHRPAPPGYLFVVDVVVIKLLDFLDPLPLLRGEPTIPINIVFDTSFFLPVELIPPPADEDSPLGLR